MLISIHAHSLMKFNHSKNQFYLLVLSALRLLPFLYFWAPHSMLLSLRFGCWVISSSELPSLLLASKCSQHPRSRLCISSCSTSFPTSTRQWNSTACWRSSVPMFPWCNSYLTLFKFEFSILLLASLYHFVSFRLLQIASSSSWCCHSQRPWQIGSIRTHRPWLWAGFGALEVIDSIVQIAVSYHGFLSLYLWREDPWPRALAATFSLV